MKQKNEKIQPFGGVVESCNYIVKQQIHNMENSYTKKTITLKFAKSSFNSYLKFQLILAIK
ncbi:unnamed protein product [Paramecium sonneborni]|uniref:Uncharacterized protein n=1 Tax=Paramecium sonneborni TaxID=65129 RepID=A0A8S1NB11_9CILI|nr:unnamed protein product [Paramecium sonneborni]